MFRAFAMIPSIFFGQRTAIALGGNGEVAHLAKLRFPKRPDSFASFRNPALAGGR